MLTASPDWLLARLGLKMGSDGFGSAGQICRQLHVFSWFVVLVLLGILRAELTFTAFPVLRLSGAGTTLDSRRELNTHIASPPQGRFTLSGSPTLISKF
jgi:hypothetical protein